MKAPFLAMCEDVPYADAVSFPNGNGRLSLIPGLGHAPHMEAPDKTLPPLIAFLNEGVGRP